MRRPTRLFALIAALAFTADQVTKAVARALLEPERVVPFVPGFWDWNLSYNTGVAFSIGHGSGWGRVVFSLVAGVACLAILFMVRRSTAGAAAMLGLVFAGALGNLVDRLLAGKVTDFILWRFGSHRWPRFNVADAVLLVGAAGLLIVDVVVRRRAAKPAAAP